MSRIEHLSESAMRRVQKARAERKAIHPNQTHYAATPLQEIGDELGVTRERARQLESRALRRLTSQQHRIEVRCRLNDAIDEWKAAKKSGVPKRMLWAIHNVDALCDALSWLDAYHDGTLAEHYEEALQKGDAPVYAGGFSASQWAGMNVSTWGHRTRGV